MKGWGMNKASRAAMCVCVIFSLVLLTGCAVKKKMAYSEGYSSSKYGVSLFPSDEAILGNEDVERILSEQVKLPAKARLAVLKLGGYNPYDASEPEQRAVENFLESLRQSPRLASVSLVPNMLVPSKATVPHLREAAARYQCDLLLIYGVNVGTYYRYRTLKSDQAKLTCVVEAALLDVRTGIVPFTSTALDEFLAEEQKGDFSFSETVDTSKFDAVGKALLKVSGDLTAFLAASPTR